MTTRTAHWRSYYWPLAALLLATPFIAMQFTSDVQWTGSDFVVFGIMLVVLGLAIEAITRVAMTGRSRLIGVGVAVFAFLWLWAELAVGVFTDWGS